jgi:hypothetical protein
MLRNWPAVLPVDSEYAPGIILINAVADPEGTMTIEQQALLPEFAELFTDADKAIAAARLAEARRHRSD